MMNTTKIKMFVVMAFVLVALGNVVHADGCCINAYTSVCDATPVSLEECCPDEPAAYGVEGAPSYEECVKRYFFEGASCVEVVNCTQGCCCDPLPSVKPQPACKAGVWTPLTEVEGLCNDEFCQQFNLTLPSLPESLPCEDPFPWVIAEPVKGEKSVRLSFGSNCEYKPSYYRIERLQLPSGSWTLIQDNFIGPGLVDTDYELMWGAFYQYKVTAVYILADGEREFSKDVNIQLGDIICWGVYDETPFCVPPNFFFVESIDRPPFMSYFRDVLGLPDDEIESYVNSTYSLYFNNAYYCDDENMAQLTLACTAQQMCVMATTGPECYARGPCSGVNPFGLFTTAREQCEQTDTGEKKYCFLDRSQTIVPKCYECDPFMECYDYKSQEACEANNCRANGAGDCQWHWVNEELGIGVCVALGRDNCKFCDSSGTGRVESYKAHNYIFNRCTEEKLRALEVPGFPCGTIYNYSCRGMVCEAITDQALCSEPVRLDSNNFIIQGSDICNGEIRICTWYNAWRKCVKDANGNNAPDCAQDDVGCQKDRYPPRTELHSYAQLTPEDSLTFEIFDRKDSQGTEIRAGLEDGYQLYICGYNGSVECGRLGYNGLASSPGSYYNMSSLSVTVADLLRDGVLTFGLNHIKYFAVDPSKNVEVIKKHDLLVQSNYENGLGVFVIKPKNNSFVNSTNVEFHVRVESIRERIWRVVLRDANTNNVLSTFYDGNPEPLVVDETRSVDFGFDGSKQVVIEALAGELEPRRVHLDLVVDTIPPEAPILDPVETLLEQNYVNISGIAEPFSTVQIYLKAGEGKFKLVDSVVVPESGRFNTVITLQQGDYWAKARAIDRAGNKGEFSDVQSFTFVTSAPTFDINPPDGAVRAFINNVTVRFHLISNKVPLNDTATYVKLIKEGTEVLSRTYWHNSTVLVLEPLDELDYGHYTVEVFSQDLLGNQLEGISNFEIAQVPYIRTNLSYNAFKTRIQDYPVSVYVDGLGFSLVEAYYEVNSVTRAMPVTLPLGNFTTYVILPLVEGENQVLFVATNNLGGSAKEPYKITLDITPPKPPMMGFE